MDMIQKGKDTLAEQIEQRNTENQQAAEQRHGQIIPAEQLIPDGVEQKQRRNTAEINGNEKLLECDLRSRGNIWHQSIG